MSRRSSAFLLTGLCTVVAMGLAGSDPELCHQSGRRTPADADAAGQRHDAGSDRREPREQACGVGERAWRHLRRHDRRGRDVEVRCRARCRVAAVSRRRGRERHGRVSALHRQRQRFPDLQDNRRWHDVVAAVPEPGSGRILRLLRLLDAHTGLCPERLRERAVPGGANDERTDVGEHRRQRACGASRRVLLRVERHLCRHGGQEQRVGRHRRRIPVQGPRHARRR